MSKEALEDNDFFKELKENMRKKAEEEDVKISYIINESKFDYSYVYVVAHSGEIQTEDNITTKELK